MFEDPLSEMERSSDPLGQRSHSSKGRSAGVKAVGVANLTGNRLEMEQGRLTEEKHTDRSIIG